MFMLAVGAVSTALVFLVLGPAYRDYRLGYHLARLTSFTEEEMQNQLIGAKATDLPFRQRFLADRRWEASLNHIGRYSPERITRELLKNGIVANSLGRAFREKAIYQLLDRLIERGVAACPIMSGENLAQRS